MECIIRSRLYWIIAYKKKKISQLILVMVTAKSFSFSDLHTTISKVTV